MPAVPRQKAIDDLSSGANDLGRDVDERMPTRGKKEIHLQHLIPLAPMFVFPPIAFRQQQAEISGPYEVHIASQFDAMKSRTTRRHDASMEMFRRIFGARTVTTGVDGVRWIARTLRCELSVTVSSRKRSVVPLRWTQLILAMVLLAIGANRSVAAPLPVDGAVAVWHMADLNDAVGKNSRLSLKGNVRCGIQLEGAEREVSFQRGGDGYVAQFEGGWLNAGQGADGELNLTGSAMTIAIRARDRSGKWACPLFGKQGGPSKTSYSIFGSSADNHGTAPILAAEIGSNEIWGVHQVETSLAEIGPTDWHDVVVRLDGNTMQLFVDGNLRDEEVAVSTLRTSNLAPCLIGAESYETTGNVDSGRQTDASKAVESHALRPDVVFENFENGNYDQWTIEGEAFGKRPSEAGEIYHHQKMKDWEGSYLADSFLNSTDAPTGKLISVPFTICRRYLGFRIAGGNHIGRTCINLSVDGKVVRSSTGSRTETLHPDRWDVSDLEGKQARLEIVDATPGESGGWGHVMVDEIFFTDRDVKPTTFRGLVDHVAVWNRALSDAEIATISGVRRVGDKQPQYYGEKYRPQFHFTPKKHWMNDPNGLVYYNGVYHLCFQHMPPGRSGAYKDWGHAVSTDLVHWKQLSSAITPHKIWGGCWSGSAVIDWNNSTGFQTGKEKPIVLIITNAGEPGTPPPSAPNTQCIAYSLDGGETFKYYDKNPVLGHIVAENRDPKVVWYAPAKKWIMALYLTGNDYGLYSSRDLKTWEHLSTLTLPGVGECPDLFDLPVDGSLADKKWVFWGGNGQHLIGSFDGHSFKPEGALRRSDYGANCYAAQTWSDIPPQDGRRIQVAWMAGGKYPGMPFDQQMSFPTEVTLRTTSEGIAMYRVPVREIEKLHEREYKWTNVDLEAGNNLFSQIQGDLFDISIEFELGDAKQFGIRVRDEPVQYDVAAKMLTCLGKSAPLNPENGRIKLRLLVDRTSLEVFGNDGRVVMTSCFLPPDENKSLEIYTSEGEIKVVSAEVYPMKSIWPQPATESKSDGGP